MQFWTTSPLVFLAVILTLVNDHFLKHSALTGVITGKISDFSGLFFFPFMIFDLCQIAAFGRLRSPKESILVFVSISVATGGFFFLLKTVAYVRNFYVAAYAYLFHLKVQVVLDPTDLWALGSLVFAVYYFANHQNSILRRI